MLNEISCDTMSLVVNWVYKEFMEGLNLRQYVALYQAAHQYNIEGLQMQCIRVLEGSVNPETVLWLEQLAAAYKEHRLEQVGFCAETAWQHHHLLAASLSKMMLTTA